MAVNDTSTGGGSIPNKYGDNDWQSPSADADAKYGSRTGTTGGLAAYCMAKVREARDERDERYEERWKEYGRLWRGFWQAQDKNANSERSKLIAPATMQAIDMTVAEMEEATFNKTAWFEIDDDLADEEKEDAVAARDLLLEEFALNDVQSAITKSFLLGCIYGTGIGKLNVVKINEPVMTNGAPSTRSRIAVKLDPVRPDQFVIDPSALNVDEAEFCAHEMLRPKTLVEQKQLSGAYNNVPLGTYNGQTFAYTDGTNRYENADSRDNGVLITEYYGKVPSYMLPNYKGQAAKVEAIVVIANGGVLLRAQESPFTMKDRPIIAYAHDVVPGEFWGRGIAEKGYNPQKALDSELRARIDALAIINAPMVGADITRLPRSPDMRVRPGKTIFTRGNPKEVFSPIELGSASVLAATFQHGSDMERMVSMATGAMDTAAPLSTNRRNETMGGMSMMGSGFIKRSKRAMGNVERNYLIPFIRKALWRYMQFDPARFKVDYKFLPTATMGIMAKEVENSQLINMLGFLEPQSPEYNMVVKAIFDNTASSSKQELNAAMETMLAPPSPEEQKMQKQQADLAMQAAQLELAQKAADVEKTKAETAKLVAEAEHKNVLADLEDDKVDIQAANAVTGAEKARMGHEQNAISRERNEIDRLKTRQEGNKKE